MSDTYAETLVILHAFAHFAHLDQANAAIHTAPVRYSPITFRLAEILNVEHRRRDLLEVGTLAHEVDQVIAHLGAYEEDRGRL